MLNCDTHKIIEELLRCLIGGADCVTAMQTTPRRPYDHRIRRAVLATRNFRRFPDLEIPVSTARTGLSRGSRPVVTAANDGHDDVGALHGEIAGLRAKAEMYLAIASVLMVVIRMFGLNLDSTRVSDGSDKARLIRKP